MYRSIKLSMSATLFMAALGLFLMSGPLSAAVSAQCLPTYSEDTFRKVYRSHKMFFEGVTDINGDGKPDAYGYQLQSNNTYKNLAIILNDGNGGFGDPVIIDSSFTISNAGGRFTDHQYGGVVAGHLNSDGKKDFVVRANSSPQAFFTFRSNEDGSYTQSAPTIVGSNEYIVDIADFNGDGIGDILTMPITSFINFLVSYNTVYYRLGNSDGTFSATGQISEANLALVSPVIGDFNGDGKPDIAFTHYLSPPNYVLQVYTNIGGGLFTHSLTFDHADANLAGTTDLNGDGKIDIWGGIELINEGTTFTRRLLPTIPTFDYDIRFLYGSGGSYLMDYDGDGHKDLVGQTDGREDQSSLLKRFYQVWKNDGTANFAKTNIYKPFLGTPADMDGDGKDDQVIFVNSTQGTPRPSATNETIVIVRENVCKAPAVRGQTRLLDFGGDNISDIALWRPDNGKWRYFSNLEERTFNWGGSQFGDIPIPGDYDGDGKTDAAVFRNPTGDWWVQRSSGGHFSVHFGLAGDIPIPRDYNGDGKTDIAVFRPSEGNWYIWYTGTEQYLFTHFGATGDIPIPGDFDGDGSWDITVFRPSEGNWYYLRSSDGGFVGFHWGLAGDIPIPGDYDADGKDDVAVFRPADHFWYVYRSFDGNAEFIQYGLSGDSPMLLDSDGDGVMELGTYRPHPQTGTWFASGQPLFTWGTYGAPNEKPLRLMLPNN